MKFTTLAASALCLTLAYAADAQTSKMPTITLPVPGEAVVVQNLSDDGKWLITQTMVDNDDGFAHGNGGSLISVDNSAEHYTISHPSGFVVLSDVSDGGEIVVGCVNNLPAYYTRSTGEWTTIQLPLGFQGGQLWAVTPDGKYAVGKMTRQTTVITDAMEYEALMVDLTTNKTVTLKNLPTIDLSGTNQHENAMRAISPDGRYILGELAFAYMGETVQYIYDRQTETFTHPGFDADLKPVVYGLHHTDAATMSPNGEWVAGIAYMVKPIAGSQFPQEYRTTFRYHVPTGDFEVYDGTYDQDVGVFSINNSGTVLAATPSENPYSSMMVRYGKYYYPLSDIYKQVYGYDFEAQTGYAVTGKPICVSADGNTIVMMPSNYESYVMHLHEPLEDVCAGIDLLGNYTVTPAPGSTFSRITTLSVNFGRAIDFYGQASDIQLLDANGNQLRSALNSSTKADASTLTVGFRATDMEQGQKYTVRIPANTVSLQGDREMSNKEINITYIGRGDKPVQLQAAAPADGATLSRLDMTTSPVLLQFDSQVAINPDLASQGILRSTGDNAQMVCNLNLVAAANQVLVYPTAGQYLYKGVSYEVEIPANAVTDISGAPGSGCAAIVLHYTGTYERELNSDGRYIFNEGCDSFTNWMLFEGDENSPVEEMTAWGFTNLMPWLPIRDSEDSTDWAFASHSMYSPAGQSNDWISTPQLFIPDDKCVLTFDSQNYRRVKRDKLKVMILASENIYPMLSAAAVEDFRANGEVVYDEVQRPGDSEETLAGDWTHNTIDLAKYAGKSIYIAFINENHGQSAVFLDNVQVLHDTRFTAVFENPERVVAQESQAIRGSIGITAVADTFQAIKLVLKDAQGQEVDKLEQSGLDLKNGSVYPFAFAQPLPLVMGEDNRFTVEVTLGDETASVSSSVRNLVFAPVQRVVLEEYTGSDCGNCPLGIRAIENLEGYFHSQFIPITLRCYGGDYLGNGVTAYAAFLGLQAAPTGMINRGGVTNPMATSTTDYVFSGQGLFDENGVEQLCWLDYVQQEFALGTDLNVDLASTYDESAKTFEATVTVTPAISLQSQDLRVFTVLTEDNLETYQSNYMSSIESAALGEWGKGGKYGQGTVYPYMAMDVARTSYGTTFAGTNGLLPANLTAGQAYTATINGALPSNVDVPANCKLTVMIIDGNTQRVVNSVRINGLSGDSAGIGDLEADSEADATVVVVDGRVVVSAEGAFRAELYTVAGSLIASADAQGFATLDAEGLQGLAIVRVATANGTKVAKVVLQ